MFVFKGGGAHVILLYVHPVYIPCPVVRLNFVMLCTVRLSSRSKPLCGINFESKSEIRISKSAMSERSPLHGAG